jgi:hypothetical protein
MASKTQKTEKIRKRKHKANKINLKKREEQITENYQVLAKFTEKN